MINPIIVKKRFGAEWTDIREFVRPNDYMVAMLVDSKPTWTILEMWEWVVKNIKYPFGVFSGPDRHHYAAYGWAGLPVLGPLLASRKLKTSDYWSFPSETLRDGMGDCEDSAFLLVSMLRRAGPSLPTYATIGFFQEFGHVWVSVWYQGQWLILDTTIEDIPPLIPTEQTRPAYDPLFRFNEQDIIIVNPELSLLPKELHQQGKDIAIASWYTVLENDYRIEAY